MGDQWQKNSTLPPVLKDYAPEYEPKTQTSRSDNKNTKFLKRPQEENNSVQQPKSHKRTEPQKVRVKSPAVKSHRKSKKTAAEHYTELSQRWDQAKQEVRLEEHEHVRKKITLQQELIRCQDERAQQLREESEQQQTKQRELEKSQKQTREIALQEICKQSLEEDRKTARDEKRAKSRELKEQQKKEDEENSSITSASTSTLRSPACTPERYPGQERYPGGLHPSHQTLSKSPFSMEAPDEYEEGERDVGSHGDLPWHHVQLYRMYGKKADYYLHPKMEKPVKKQLNPKIRWHGGRAGADSLWENLRYDTTQKLLCQDAHIPQELKLAFSAFVRSRDRTKQPVRRNFTACEDVPELERLLDQTVLSHVKNLRHKRDLMYRASQTNKDRTEVLTFNNPLPDMNDADGEVGINRYLPSWLDDYDEFSEQDYRRWIRGRLEPHEEAEEDELYKGDDSGDFDSDRENKPLEREETYDPELLELMPRRKQPASSKPRYIFLTEKDATVKGQFASKFREKREHKGIPRAFDGDQVQTKSKSVMEVPESQDSDRRSSDMDIPTCQSAPLLARQHMNSRYISPWQPLSMNALVEYKENVDAMGEGSFNHGRTKMWPAVMTPS